MIKTKNILLNILFSLLLISILILIPAQNSYSASGYSSSLSGMIGSLPQTPNLNSLPPQEKNQILKSLSNKNDANKYKYKNKYKKSSSIFKKTKAKRFIAPFSKIEIMYNRLYRFKKPLKQFGYGFFNKRKKIATTLIGAIGKDYIVGPGDTLTLYLSGSPTEALGIPNSIKHLKVNREGMINLPFIGSVYVWGKTLGMVKQIISADLSSKFKNVMVTVSLDKLRQFSVYVTGFVRNPGPVIVNGTYTVLDALSMAGGVSREGSLRDIIVRKDDGNGYETSIHIDLYNLLINGEPVDTYLQQGETIYVPPIGKTVAIGGSVKRPGIYEIKNNEDIKQVLQYAGGLQFFSHKTNVKIIRLVNGKYIAYNNNITNENFLNSPAKNGEVLAVGTLFTGIINHKFKVAGAVKYPGVYSTKQIPDLKTLFKAVGILKTTNLDYAQIVNSYDGKIIEFSPERVIKGKLNIKLKTGDKINFYPIWILKPIEISGQGIKMPKFVAFYKGITLLKALKSIKFLVNPGSLKALIFVRKHVNYGYGKGNYKHVYQNYGRSRKHSRYGQNGYGYQNYGRNNIRKNNISQPINVVYLQKALVEGERKFDVKLRPGESILIQKLKPTDYSATVTVLGQVRRPGVYRLKKGMTLYQLIVDAGGYTSSAYPKAMVFIRKSVRRMQRIQLNNTILNLQSSLSQNSAITGIGSNSQEQLMYKATLMQQTDYLKSLKKLALRGLGRIALNIPDRLRYLRYSDQNIKLNAGDKIYIPPKPDFVLVMGAVFNQMAIPYIHGKTVGWYLRQAGGYRSNANSGEIYLIKANGRIASRRFYSSFWSFIGLGNSFMHMPVKPGDTIVVPAEFKAPILWMPLIKDITQIMFQSISTVALVRYL